VGAARREAELGRILDELLARPDLRARSSLDPVSFVHRYEQAEDKEIVALLASSLAFGNVKAFRPKIQSVLDALGDAPARAAEDRRALLRALSRWKHRLYTGRDVALLLSGARKLQREHGTLGAAFAVFLASAKGELREAASAFVRQIRARAGLDLEDSVGSAHLFVDPANGSAAKRVMLFLRWMIRPADGVDTGLWSHIAPRALLVPVDVHIHRLGKNLGLTTRASASWKTAEDITRRLRVFDPSDPVKYDFALCHMGMLQRCPSRRDAALCEGCGVKPVCLHWR
jgi:uncharacterized protein (TIGR02757 family)